ncbi:hypothetical protein [Neobacillus sp. D3-1R]|uniref:hypothetical protein n=1 Tax=Neobacillus sp. D3-1R TaxID=3445778 RepID=UPI003FA02EBC
MKCEECRYEHTKLEKYWEYNGEIDGEHSYTILSNIYDIVVYEGIMNHALTLQKKPFEEIEVYIDTWRIECPSCQTCSLTNVRLMSERHNKSNYYFKKGIREYESF